MAEAGIDAGGAIATEEDVVSCYRVLLGREPEGPEIVREKLAMQLPVWHLIRTFLASDEADARLFAQAGQRISNGRYGNAVELGGTPEQLDALFAHVRQVWARYGNEEPYWSVLTAAEFRRAAMNAASQKVFYHSGRISCDIFNDACIRNEVMRPTEGVVLDFGCGVGRLGEHLSRDFDRYVGVDISGPHLALAKSRMQQIGRDNCEFLLLPDFLDSPLRFDAFMSLIVLQHNPPPVMYLLLNSLLGRLKPGGVGYFQLPCIIFGYEFRLADYLEMIVANKSMEMHAMPQRMVFQAIAENNCRALEVTLDELIGNIGLSYTFLVVKL